jgi:hypothetical protein
MAGQNGGGVLKVSISLIEERFRKEVFFGAVL